MIPCNKIIVRVPNWLGDCIMATPMLRRLRELNPEAHIAVIGQKAHWHIFEGNSNIDKMLLYDSLKIGGQFLRAVSDLRAMRFDLGYILPNSLSSALVFALGQVNQRIGYATQPRGWLLNQGQPWPGQVEHRAVRYLRLVDHDPDITERAVSYPVEMPIGDQDHTLADELLREIDTAKAVALNPCSITPTRRWFPDRFARLADRVYQELGFEAVLVGGPSREDYQACTEVKALAQSAKITILAGKTGIRSLAALLGRLRLLVTCNTGTMHIASTTGTPMVVMTGSSDIKVTAPWGVDYRVILKDLPCYPCWKNECPMGTERPECMTSITVEDVFKEVADLLANG